MVKLNISFAGAGRVAGSLCDEMFHAGLKIVHIVSESEKNGPEIAVRCNAQWSDKLIFPENCELIMVSVPDHRLEAVLSQIRCSDRAIVVHTAGSFGLEVFPSRISRSGVFYPLQTFSKGRHIEYNNLPILLESADPSIIKVLRDLALILGSKPYVMDAGRRMMMHLAAVFVCNFTNFMLTAGEKVVSEAQMPFDLLVPLIRETISKAIENGPGMSQTGPALRHDLNTIQKHLDLLSFSPELQSMYREISGSIMHYYNN